MFHYNLRFSQQLHLAMRSTTVLLFFLSQSAADFSTEENSIFSRSSYFDVRENTQLIGYVVKWFYSPNLLSCSQECMRNAWCTSTNYKMSSEKDGKGTCELNKHDISLIKENTNIHNRQGVTFSALLDKGSLSRSCFNGGSCLPDKEKQTFSCSCLPPWTGASCDVKLGCPQDWVHHQDSCYYVINTPTPDWSHARTTCLNLGGDLAIIKSEDENNFIFELLRKQQKLKPLGAWLGLFRKADNAFYWIDGTPLAGQYSAWAIGQPSRVQEKCVHIYVGHVPGKWNDMQCSLSGAYKSQFPVVLCEKRFM